MSEDLGEQVTALEVKMDNMEKSGVETKDSVKEIFKTQRQVMLATLGGMAMILADIIFHLAK